MDGEKRILRNFNFNSPLPVSSSALSSSSFYRWFIFVGEKNICIVYEKFMLVLLSFFTAQAKAGDEDGEKGEERKVVPRRRRASRRAKCEWNEGMRVGKTQVRCIFGLQCTS